MFIFNFILEFYKIDGFCCNLVGMMVVISVFNRGVNCVVVIDS